MESLRIVYKSNVFYSKSLSRWLFLHFFVTFFPSGPSAPPGRQGPIPRPTPSNTLAAAAEHHTKAPAKPPFNQPDTYKTTLYYIYFPYYIVYDFTRTPQPAYPATARRETGSILQLAVSIYRPWANTCPPPRNLTRGKTDALRAALARRVRRPCVKNFSTEGAVRSGTSYTKHYQSDRYYRPICREAADMKILK